MALDVAYLEGMGAEVRGRMAELQAEIYREAGEEFNLNSPPQLRVILYEKLGLSPGKTHAEGSAVHRRERAGEAPRSSRSWMRCSIGASWTS